MLGKGLVNSTLLLLSRLNWEGIQPTYRPPAYSERKNND
nr:MAG TPA: hypothetical protein [Myoviridae sp. ct3tv2]